MSERLSRTATDAGNQSLNRLFGMVIGSSTRFGARRSVKRGTVVRAKARTISRGTILRRTALLTMLFGALTISAFALGGCSASVATGTADNAIYNASYVGDGAIQRSYAGAASQPTSVTLTLSTLGADFSGTLSSTLKSGLSSYAGGVSGRVTPTGGDFTYVQSDCVGTLHGSFVLNSDGTLSGSAVGRDCNAGSTGDNVRISFSNLVRR